MRRRSEPSKWWTVAPEWRGETAFVIAGGPSLLTQNVEQLRGRKVVVINSSCYLVPWGDILFFRDARWWRENRRGCDAFQGRVVSVDAVPDPRVLRWLKRPPERGFSTSPEEVMTHRTAVSAVLNALAHLAAARIVLLGVDNKFGKDGRRNHHAPHKWKHINGTWEKQRTELSLTVKPLRERGIEVLNASPGSALGLWPIVNLEDCL